MDTATHLVMGIGLFGLSQLDPAITQNTDMLIAASAGTVIGSQIPDIDTLYRLKGNAAYVRNHRGWTHSLLLCLVWSTAITLVISLFLSLTSPISIWLWTSVAVFIHVGIDCFNTYGTQAIRPFRNKWVSFNIINIFDPIIFGIYLIGILSSILFSKYAGSIFVIIHALLLCYIIWQTIVHHRLTNWMKNQFQEAKRVTVTPTFRLGLWNLIVELETEVKIGEIQHQSIEWTGSLSRADENHPATKHSKESNAIASFLSFTSYGYPQVQERDSGYEVKWLDVRYHHKKHFPFVAIALLDQNYQITYSFVGWRSEKRAQKKAGYRPK